jgi:arginine N-succinyltransferase
MADLDAVLRLARAGGSGLTNLPPDRSALEHRIRASERAIAGAEARNSGSAIILVGEFGGEIVAIGMVFARVGAEWPFYSYKLTRQAAVSRTLGRSKAQMLLNLVNDFDGETEVGGLFVDPARRGLALGRLMARARYMFIARHREWFANRVIAELRGFQDESGRAPLWEAIGRHFYEMDFQDADRTGAIQGNQFIADLGPRYPIYVSTLPLDAQAAVGRPHDDGRPARDMLLSEGFRDAGYVDIFDGGPTLVADIDAVRTVRLCERRILHAVRPLDDAAPSVLASFGSAANFRVTIGGAARSDDDRVALEPALVEALGARVGEEVAIVAD